MRLDAVLVALVAVAWLPANHYVPWSSAWQEGLALAALGGAALLLSRPARLAPGWLAFLVLALASLAAQALAGVVFFTGDAWVVAMYLAGFGLALAVGSSLARPAQGGAPAAAPGLELLCGALMVSALACAGIGFAQWAGVQRLGIFGADLAPGDRPFANFAQPNHWCTASIIGLAAAWVLFESRRIGGFTLGLVAAVLLAAVVASGSRTGWLQLSLGVVLVLALHRRAALRLPRLAPLLALPAVAAAWALWPLLNAATEPGVARSLAEQASVGVRWPLWTALPDAIAERPWTGYGWSQMVLAQQAVALDGPPLHRHFEYAHNLVLDLLIWVGVPLALLLLALAGWQLLQLVRHTRDARAAGLLLVAGAVLVHGMLEYAVAYAYFLVPMGLALGAAGALAGRPALQLPKPALLAVAAGFALLFALVAVDYVKAEQAYRLHRLESARIGTDRLGAEVPSLRVLDQLEAHLRFLRTEPRPGLDAEALALGARVAQRFAYPSAQFRQARTLALNGDAAGAARTLRLLCAMHAPRTCREAGESWQLLQQSEPALRAVPPPAP